LLLLGFEFSRWLTTRHGQRITRITGQLASSSDSRREIHDKALKAVLPAASMALSRHARGQPLALSGIFEQGND
jgi:hypothetical protein